MTRHLHTRVNAIREDRVELLIGCPDQGVGAIARFHLDDGTVVERQLSADDLTAASAEVMVQPHAIRAWLVAAWRRGLVTFPVEP